MSENKPVRTAQEIVQENAALSQRLGYVQYQIFVHESDAQLLKEKIRDLNFEYAALKEKEAATPAPAPEQSPALEG